MEDNRNRCIMPVFVGNIRTLADKSIKIELVTQELSAANMANLFQLHHTQGFALLSTMQLDDLTELDEEQIEAFNGKPKTQSQRIRNVLYKIWELTGGAHGDFNSFYKSETEMIISKLKMRLE